MIKRTNQDEDQDTKNKYSNQRQANLNQPPGEATTTGARQPDAFAAVFFFLPCGFFRHDNTLWYA